MNSLSLSLNGFITAINLTGASLFDALPNQLLNCHFLELVSPEDSERWDEAFKAMRTSLEHAHTFKIGLQRIDNTTFHAQLNCCVKLVDNTRIVQITLTDIIEQYHLNEISARVTFLYCLQPNGHAYFPFIIDNAHSILRLSPTELQDDASRFFALIHPNDCHDYHDSLQKSKQDMIPWNHVYRVKFDDGAIHWLWGNALPQRKADGSILWHGFYTDITRHIHLKDRLNLDIIAIKIRTALEVDLHEALASQEYNIAANQDGKNREQLSLDEGRAISDNHLILASLDFTNNNISRSAKLLGISRVSLYRLLNKHGITGL